MAREVRTNSIVVDEFGHYLQHRNVRVFSAYICEYIPTGKILSNKKTVDNRLIVYLMPTSIDNLVLLYVAWCAGSGPFQTYVGEVVLHH